MSNPIKDGGPAFPWEDANSSPGQPMPSSGMTTRTYIATHALNGYLSGRMHDTRTMPDGPSHHEFIAKTCLQYADALIAELNRKETSK